MIKLIFVLLLIPGIASAQSPPPGAAPRGFPYIIIEGGPLGTIYLPNAYELLGCVTDAGLHTVTCGSGGGGDAPANAAYLTQTPNGTLSAEQAMSLLGTGLVFNTTTTGVQSIYAGTTCTNQFTRALSAAGVATCATVDISTDTNLSATSPVVLTGDVLSCPTCSTGNATSINGATLGTTTATDKNILIADGSTWVSRAMSGDATIGNTGVLTIGNNKITGAMIALGSDTAGDIMYYDGTDWVRLAKPASGIKFLQGGTAPSWADPTTSISMPHSANNRKWAVVQVANGTVTTMTVANGGVLGMPTPGVLGTASNVRDTRTWMRYTTATTVNSIGGLAAGATNPTFSDARPKWTARIRTKSTLPSAWTYGVEISDASFIARTTIDATTGKGVLAAATQGVNSDKWMCCAADGTNVSCTSMAGTAVAAATEYLITVDYTVGGIVTCTVDGNSEILTQTYASNLPTGTTGLDVIAMCRSNPEGTAGIIDFDIGVLEQN